jgi:hypothetical protein
VGNPYRWRRCGLLRGTEWEFVMEAKHTQLPWDWSVGVIYARFESGEVVAATDGTPFAAMDGATQCANAAFIVRACNSHDALVEALSAVVRHGLVPPKGEYKFAQEKYLGDLCHAALALAGETP